jgi:hypothetical protein
MKKLILASILMAFGASAQADVTVGNITCSGPDINRQCSATITCVGQCNTTVASGTNNCIPLPAQPTEDVELLVATRERSDPVCIWQVIDTGGGVTEVTIDSSDGLPVELQSLSVE